MQPLFLPEPTEDFWRKRRSTEFQQKFNFLNYMSAVDSKHVIMRKPLRSGNYYFNSKQAFSIVLMVGVDVNYKFTFVDISTKGRFSDAYIFTKSNFGK